jgi:hypothetical protein
MPDSSFPALLRLADRRMPSRLYHYTTQAGLLGILREGYFFATSVAHLSDASELTYSIDLAHEVISDAANNHMISTDQDVLYDLLDEGLNDLRTTTVYIVSLSERRDQLSQWRAYAGGSGGYNLGLNTKLLLAACPAAEWSLYPCDYSRRRQKRAIAEILSTAHYTLEHSSPQPPDLETIKTATNMFLNHFLHYAPLLKDPTFAEEKEWRLVSNPYSRFPKPDGVREGRSFLVPYRHFYWRHTSHKSPIASVMIGPNPHPEVAERAVSSLLMLHPDLRVTVGKSRSPYRQW